ncbi:MAG: amidohydrolase family protein [Bacteroidetes bacterium]|nr:amidohydrolase family protein [Bacteroidota bacterium]MCZ6900945.1 amidohydrolase family protein [Bacteroidota bacterium]
MKIDTHQHFWKFDPVRYSWINDTMQVLRKDFLPDDLNPDLKRNAIDGCIAVQADQSEKETQFLLDLATEYNFIKGVVGWLDLRDKNVGDRLDFYSQNNLLKGLRHIVQSELDDFMIQENFQRGIGILGKYNLTYDILIYPNQMNAAFQLISKYPDQLFVIDHLAKPSIKKQLISTWENEIKKLALWPNVSCKLSGLVTEADWNNWKMSDFRPYLDVVVEAFGIKRVMFGSDWPVCLLAASYSQVFNIVADYFENFTVEEKEKVFGTNAIKFYNI